MLISPDLIAPSQDFLKANTVQFIFDCLNSGKTEELPVVPIVRRDENDRLVAIDGHNILAVMSFLNRDIEVHIAESAVDGLSETTAKNKQRNAELKNKFDKVITARDETAAKGILTFTDLINRNLELFEKV